MAGFLLKVHFHYQTSLQRLCNLSKLLICYRTPADGLSRGAADNFRQVGPAYQRLHGGMPMLPLSIPQNEGNTEVLPMMAALDYLGKI